jgi:erythromycin esterase
MPRPTVLILALTLAAGQAEAQAPLVAASDTAAIRASFREQAARHPHTAWLRQNAAPIRSIDPSEEDFSDLEPLRAAIGDAQVVMLGEQTHGDGSTILGKARLVRFLHQEMGFDVLAFESPMYDVAKAQRQIEQGRPAPEALTTVFRRGYDQFQPVIEYVERQARTRRPLLLAGFDSQSHLQLSKDSLALDLQGLLQGLGLDPEVLDEGAPLRLALTEITNYRATEPWAVDTLNALAAQVMQRSAGMAPTDPDLLLRQVLVSLPHFARQATLDAAARAASSGVATEALFMASGAVRDAQMGRNLIWLAENQHTDKKIIVWAATGHTRYRTLLLDDPLRDHRYSYAAEEAPMGQWVQRGLGERVYSIMFTSYTGSSNAPGWWAEAYPIEAHTDYNTRPELDFEDWMNATGFRYAFVDLRKPGSGGEWLKEPFVARPWSNTAILSRWSENTDALFFIHRGRSLTLGCPFYAERELGTLPVSDPAVPAACLIE